MKLQVAILPVLLALLCGCASIGKPRPDAGNTFHILAIWNDLMKSTTPDKIIRAEMDKLIAQCGRGNRYHRLGFSFIYPMGNPDVLRRNCRLAKEKGLVLGIIIGLQTHGNISIQRQFVSDLRNYQWRNDGLTWTPLPEPKKGLDSPKNIAPISPSRYCDAVHKGIEASARKQAREILSIMREYPDIVAVINPLIEQGLGGFTNNAGALIFNDCGPYATTEFRDWLRHTGRYDASSGQYPGQGAPTDITGPFVEINGKSRSPFYDDPTPADANKTGKSFNETFGTSFTTWTLRYHDLSLNTKPITDPTTPLMPKDGPAFVPGGFDMPRTFVKNDPYWRAWAWVNQDHGGYPPGNPKSPSFGFSQVMSRNYVMDVFDWLIAEGLPTDRLYAHQVPCEALGDSPGGLMQSRTMAMTAWTGYIPACQTVGITRFGPIDPASITQYAPHWGIFEWHPQPGAAPNAQQMYDAAKRDLENYWSKGCRFLFPGWWEKDGTHIPIFALNDSRFADAIRDFLKTRPDCPAP